MDTRASNLPDLNLDDVRERVYAKYAVTEADAQLAVEYLRCFLDARKKQPNELIILPQIADWAWHELILDTARYRDVCSEVFGRFLHHVATDVSALQGSEESGAGDFDAPEWGHALSRIGLHSDDLRGDFSRSLAKMHRDYGLGAGACPEEWLEAGWDKPEYRLRNPVQIFRDDGDQRKDTAGLASNKVKASILSWLPTRIARRFGVSLKEATRGVDEYWDRFSALRGASASEAFNECSALCEAAWEEHILWTEHYAQDCQDVLGYFLDHAPRANIRTAEGLAH